MSIFNNVIFDEFTLLEGEQAEAYKKRKAEEKEDQEEEDFYRYRLGRDKAGDKYTRDHPDNPDRIAIGGWGGYPESDKDAKKLDKFYKGDSEDYNRAKKSEKSVERHFGKDIDKLDNYNKVFSAIDAKNRHIRRHPKQYQESVFEDIEMI